MSRKNKYRKTHHAAAMAGVPASHEVRVAEEFNPASDLKAITVVISLCVGLLLGLYYYDKQTGILQVLTDKLTTFF